MNKRQSHLKELSKAKKKKTCKREENPFLKDKQEESVSSHIKQGLNFAIAFFVTESAQKTIESSLGDSPSSSPAKRHQIKGITFPFCDRDTEGTEVAFRTRPGGTSYPPQCHFPTPSLCEAFGIAPAVTDHGEL